MRREQENFLLPGYYLGLGSRKDRPLLVQFLTRSYQEYVGQQQDFSHLALTVEQYFSTETPLWWVQDSQKEVVGCLWMGNAIDQVDGIRYAHIFLLYVNPSHRRRGIGSKLMEYAQNWAKARGDRKIGLQVFHNNEIAIGLYSQLGYSPQSLLMFKSLA